MFVKVCEHLSTMSTVSTEILYSSLMSTSYVCESLSAFVDNVDSVNRNSVFKFDEYLLCLWKFVSICRQCRQCQQKFFFQVWWVPLMYVKVCQHLSTMSTVSTKILFLSLMSTSTICERLSTFVDNVDNVNSWAIQQYPTLISHSFCKSHFSR